MRTNKDSLWMSSSQWELSTSTLQSQLCLHLSVQETLRQTVGRRQLPAPIHIFLHLSFCFPSLLQPPQKRRFLLPRATGSAALDPKTHPCCTNYDAVDCASSCYASILCLRTGNPDHLPLCPDSERQMPVMICRSLGIIPTRNTIMCIAATG